MRTRLRRTAAGRPETLTIGDLTIDVAGHAVKRDDAPISLTPLEFDLLARARAQAAAGLHPRDAAPAGVGLPLRGRHAPRQRPRAAPAREDRARPRRPADRHHGSRRRLPGGHPPDRGANSMARLAARLATLWRSSLQVRTVAITLALSAVAVCSSAATCLQRRRQPVRCVEPSSRRTCATATLAGQRSSTGRRALGPRTSTRRCGRRGAILAPRPPRASQFAILRAPGQDGANTPSIETTGLETERDLPRAARGRPDRLERAAHLLPVGALDGGRRRTRPRGRLAADVPGAAVRALSRLRPHDAAETLGFVQQTLRSAASRSPAHRRRHLIVVRLVVGPVRSRPRRARSSPRASSRCASR